MGVVVLIAASLAVGFVVGGLARFALPGPDPLPVWMTIALGIAGSAVGGVVNGLAGVDPRDGQEGAVSLLAPVLGATLLLLVYRRVIQGRPITGPEAHRPPQGSRFRRGRRPPPER